MCMDFRFQKNIQHWLEEEGYLGASDEVIVAGASRDLVKPLEEFHKDALLRQIELSVKLHDPDEIVVIDHQDCGGYAQDGTIESGLELEEDRKQHIEYANQAKVVLEEKFPGKKIRMMYATMEGEINELTN